jgi:hypothetical protein
MHYMVAPLIANLIPVQQDDTDKTTVYFSQCRFSDIFSTPYIPFYLSLTNSVYSSFYLSPANSVYLLTSGIEKVFSNRNWTSDRFNTVANRELEID